MICPDCVHPEPLSWRENPRAVAKRRKKDSVWGMLRAGFFWPQDRFALTPPGGERIGCESCSVLITRETLAKARKFACHEPVTLRAGVRGLDPGPQYDKLADRSASGNQSPSPAEGR